VTDRDTLLRQRVAEHLAATRRLAADTDALTATAKAADRIADSLRAGGKALFFGNGGSATDAGHLTAELLGRLHHDRRPLAALSLPDHTATLTAIANDYSYDDVFARQIHGLARPGDIAIALSTSGTSPNIIRGLDAAHHAGLTTIAFTGATGGKLNPDIAIKIPSDETPRIQELTLLLGHTLCEIVERELTGA
jgi:D-sedoheptulose 7-phosphate isomerase